jgi:hypothetical protein
MVKAQNFKPNSKPSFAKAPKTKQATKQQAKAQVKQQEVLKDIHLTHKQLVALLCGPINFLLVRNAVKCQHQALHGVRTKAVWRKGEHTVRH